MINDRFREFYSQVYTSQGNVEKENLRVFCWTADISSYWGGHQCTRCWPWLKITQCSNFIISKRQGPRASWLQHGFLKKIREEVTLLLLRMFNHSKEATVLPPTLYNASITVIPKPGRDPLLASSYRPISLLPSETKIIGKILADRLKKYICSIVHPD